MNTSTDPNNCGACSVTCVSGQSCVSGQCQFGGADSGSGGCDAGPSGCDPVAQTGCCGSTSKCTIVVTGTGASQAYSHVCLAPSGTATQDQSCTRTSLGHDDCAAGTICTRLGTEAAATDVHCRAFCNSDADCTVAGERCANLTTPAPFVGVCIPQCLPYTGDCTDGGLTCGFLLPDNDQQNFVLSCRQIGTAPAGSTACGTGSPPPGDVACAANLSCVRNSADAGFACTPLCDSTSPCTTGTCTPFPGIQADGGYCF